MKKLCESTTNLPEQVDDNIESNGSIINDNDQAQWTAELSESTTELSEMNNQSKSPYVGPWHRTCIV